MYKINLNENVYLGGNIEFNIRIATDKESLMEAKTPEALAYNVYREIVEPMIKEKKDNKPLDWRVTQGDDFVGVISWNGRFWDKDERNGADYWNMSIDEIKENIMD